LITGAGRALKVGAVQAEVKDSALSLRRELQRRATMEAADIVARDMPDALFCADRLANLDYALSLRGQNGLILEFGVYRGASITHIAERCPGETIYGFDSFRGLPDQWRGKRFSPDNFNLQGALPKVPANVRLLAGWFQETLPPFLAANQETVSFLHVDCDLYDSTAYVLGALRERLAEGAVLVFDEFFNYHGFRLHEFRAFHEFIAETGRNFTYASYAGQQVTVVLR
jgi:predicted O-methyltransferase YrrM